MESSRHFYALLKEFNHPGDNVREIVKLPWAQGLTAAGASELVLAHLSKHRNEDGDKIFEVRGVH